MWFLLPCCSPEVQSPSPLCREMINTKKVECSLALTLQMQGWKWQVCIGSSIISLHTVLPSYKGLCDLAPLKSICMILLVYLQLSLQLVLRTLLSQFLMWEKIVSIQRDRDMCSSSFPVSLTPVFSLPDSFFHLSKNWVAEVLCIN